MKMKKLRYYRGSNDCFETIKFDVTKKGQDITTCVVKVSLLLAGIKSFPCDNGNDIILTAQQRIKILKFLQAERKKITDGFLVKTYNGWLQSGLPTFEDYCFPGDEVDEDIVDYFVNSVPPITLRSSCTQAGEADSVEQDSSGRYRNTYTTFHCIENRRWRYDGLCFRNCNENKVEKPYSSLKLDLLISEAQQESETNA